MPQQTPGVVQPQYASQQSGSPYQAAYLAHQQTITAHSNLLKAAKGGKKGGDAGTAEISTVKPIYPSNMAPGTDVVSQQALVAAASNKLFTQKLTDGVTLQKGGYKRKKKSQRQTKRNSKGRTKRKSKRQSKRKSQRFI